MQFASNLIFRRYLSPSLKKEALVSIHPASIFDFLSFEATLTERCTILHGWSLLLVYVSQPHCVVIGRHQNPWLECKPKKIITDGGIVARRISGGGTVYHDSGNVNFSMITNKADYDRRKNLEMLVASLKKCGVSESDLTVTDMFDVMLGGSKISGTAARLDKHTAMHHFTCLVDSKLSAVSSYLQPAFSAESTISNRATPSRPAAVVNAYAESGENLSNLSISTDSLTKNFIGTYFDGDVVTCEPISWDVKRFFGSDNMLMTDYERRREEYRSWDWVFGKTPPFAVRHSFEAFTHKIEVEFSFENGCVANFDMKRLGDGTNNDVVDCKDHLSEVLIDLPLCCEDVDETFLEISKHLETEFEKIIFDNIHQFLMSICPDDPAR